MGQMQDNLTDFNRHFHMVLKDYSIWMSYVLRFLFYSSEKNLEQQIMVPESFDKLMDVLDKIDKARPFDGGKISINIKKIESDLIVFSQIIVDEVKVSAKPPEYEKFDALMTLYNRFMHDLRSFGNDVTEVLRDGGDVLAMEAGETIKKAIKQDIMREMIRRSRKGNPFCLVMARIDNFGDLVNGLTEVEQFEYTNTVENRMKEFLRDSFDDFHRTGENEFVMILKHANRSGGITAINRFREFLQKNLKDGSEELRGITLSYCVSEPEPGDDIDFMIETMRKNLDEYDDLKDQFIEYKDKSALEQYLESSGMAE